MGDQAGTLGEEALSSRNVKPPAGVTPAIADSGFDQAGLTRHATTVFNSRPDCKDHTANEDQIRKMLHLPLVT